MQGIYIQSLKNPWDSSRECRLPTKVISLAGWRQAPCQLPSLSLSWLPDNRSRCGTLDCVVKPLVPPVYPAVRQAHALAKGLLRVFVLPLFCSIGFICSKSCSILSSGVFQWLSMQH